MSAIATDMVTQTASASKCRRNPFRTGLHQLPLRKLGFKHVPAVPVDIPGMVDIVMKLGVKSKVYDQALRGLSNTYTIGGSTTRAYTFLYGGEEADKTRGAAQEQLHGFLRRNPSEFDESEVAEKLEE